MTDKAKRTEFTSLLAQMEDLMKGDKIYTFVDGYSSLKVILNSSFSILKDVFGWADEMACPEEFLCAYIEKHIRIVRDEIEKARARMFIKEG